MSSHKDPYKVLELDKNATMSEVKKAYFRLAKKHHPDNNKTKQAQDRFLEIQQAYETLTKPEKARPCDRSAGFSTFWRPDADPTRHFEDLFATIFKRAEVGLEIRLGFMEAALGTTKTVEMDKPVVCQTCKGKGRTGAVCRVCKGNPIKVYRQNGMMFQIDCEACRGTGLAQLCSMCQGKGSVIRTHKMELQVPPGVEDLSMMVVNDHSEPKSGRNVRIQFRVDKHPTFERKGYDIYSNITIPFPKAIFGGVVQVPTIRGSIELALSPSTRSQTVKTLKHKGIFNKRLGRFGDHHVTILIDVPSTLTTRQKELLSDFEQPIQEQSLSGRAKDWIKNKFY